MARYENLPIYRTAVELAVFLEKQVRTMPRYNKYSLGSELRRLSIQIIELVVRANTTHNKLPVLEELKIRIEQIKQLLFVSKEAQVLPSFGFYMEAMAKVESLARQNEGWRKSQGGR